MVSAISSGGRYEGSSCPRSSPSPSSFTRPLAHPPAEFQMYTLPLTIRHPSVQSRTQPPPVHEAMSEVQTHPVFLMRFKKKRSVEDRVQSSSGCAPRATRTFWNPAVSLQVSWMSLTMIIEVGASACAWYCGMHLFCALIHYLRCSRIATLHLKISSACVSSVSRNLPIVFMNGPRVVTKAYQGGTRLPPLP